MACLSVLSSNSLMTSHVYTCIVDELIGTLRTHYDPGLPFKTLSGMYNIMSAQVDHPTYTERLVPNVTDLFGAPVYFLMIDDLLAELVRQASNTAYSCEPDYPEEYYSETSGQRIWSAWQSTDACREAWNRALEREDNIGERCRPIAFYLTSDGVNATSTSVQAWLVGYLMAPPHLRYSVPKDTHPALNLIALPPTFDVVGQIDTARKQLIRNEILKVVLQEFEKVKDGITVPRFPGELGAVRLLPSVEAHSGDYDELCGNQPEIKLNVHCVGCEASKRDWQFSEKDRVAAADLFTEPREAHKDSAYRVVSHWRGKVRAPVDPLHSTNAGTVKRTVNNILEDLTVAQTTTLNERLKQCSQSGIPRFKRGFISKDGKVKGHLKFNTVLDGARLLLYCLPGVCQPGLVKNLAGLLHFQLYQQSPALDESDMRNGQALADEYSSNIYHLHHVPRQQRDPPGKREATFKDHSTTAHAMRDRKLYGIINTEHSERAFGPMIRTPLSLSDGINKLPAIVRMVQRKTTVIEAVRAAEMRRRREELRAAFGVEVDTDSEEDEQVSGTNQI